MKKYIYSFAVCAALFCTSCDESRLNISRRLLALLKTSIKPIKMLLML